MNKTKPSVKKLGAGESSSISGGFVVKVNPKDLEKEKLDLKKYLVVDNSTGKIINSFDKYDDAVACDAVEHSNKDWIYKVTKGDLKNHIFKSLDDGSMVFKHY